MIFSYQNTCLLEEKTILETVQQLTPYITYLQTIAEKNNYDDLESSINLSTDQNIVNEVLSLKNGLVTTNLKYIIDIGIGGSNLGTKAIYDALHGYFDIIETQKFPKIIFADTTSPTFLKKLSDFLETQISKPEEILLNAISKSGGTTETIANLEIIFAVLEKKFPNIKERLVITTDHGSKLWQLAQDKNIKTLTLPKQVGGRYSVFSAVGLFPLAAAGLDIAKLLTGAQTMREQCLHNDNNPAALSASILYLNMQSGKNINDNFFFAPELESIGKWYRQLMGESIGKDGKGITPTVSIGSTDLHSMGQLYLGGPKDKITTFINVNNHTDDVSLPASLQFPLIENIASKKTATIMKAIIEGVKVAYTKKQHPFMEIILDDISETSLGEFLQFKMIEMMYLGKLMGVNPFDQPEVELYKVETKRILSEEQK